jgi:flavin-dependent dehydrogenase
VEVRGLYRQPFVARALTRRDLDARLVQEAVAAGVQMQEQVRVVEPIVDEQGGTPIVRGACLATRDGRRLRVPAALTIAADGRRSTLAFALGLARQPARPRRWVVSGYFENVMGMSDVGEMHIRAHHYMGVAPLPHGLANVCYVSAMRDGFSQPSSLLTGKLAADPLLRERFAHARLVAPVGQLGPLAVGLRFALRGGELAAEVAREFLDAPDRAWHEVLTERRAREFSGKQRFNRAVRALVSSERAVSVAARLTAIAPGMLQHMIRYAADLRTT